MNRENFKKDKRKVFLCCVVYSCICEVISLFVLGFDSGFAAGIFIGTACVIINFNLIELVVDFAIMKKSITLAFLLQLGRLLIFGAVGYGCYLISFSALIAFGICSIGIVIAAVITYGKEGTNGQL